MSFSARKLGVSGPDSSLPGLPHELRLQILSELLTPTGLVTFGTTHFQTPQFVTLHKWRLETPLFPAILRTNRQLYHEGRELLYVKNMLRISLPVYPLGHSPYVCKERDAKDAQRPNIALHATENPGRSDENPTKSSYTLEPELLLRFRKFSFCISWGIQTFVYMSYPHWLNYNPSTIDFQGAVDSDLHQLGLDQLPQIIAMISKRLPERQYLEVRLELISQMEAKREEEFREAVALCQKKIRGCVTDQDYFKPLRTIDCVSQASIRCGTEAYDRDMERQIVANKPRRPDPPFAGLAMKRHWRNLIRRFRTSKQHGATNPDSISEDPAGRPVATVVEPNTERSVASREERDAIHDPILAFLNAAIRLQANPAH